MGRAKIPSARLKTNSSRFDSPLKLIRLRGKHLHRVGSVFLMCKGIIGKTSPILACPVDEFKHNMVLLIPIFRLGTESGRLRWP